VVVDADATVDLVNLEVGVVVVLIAAPAAEGNVALDPNELEGGSGVPPTTL
jgi:hypothetical protein